mgnify:CR=1 FL=1
MKRFLALLLTMAFLCIGSVALADEPEPFDLNKATEHFATPIVLGVSKPVYSRKELADINKRSTEGIEYKGQKMSRYEASQRQRQMETAIRYAKDERDAMVAAGDKLGATQARKKSAALSAEYKRFCEQAGLTPRPERTRSMTGPTVQRV